ncbi:MAG: MlaD family protein [Bacteroidota bacterium]|nr:MlaD family protein [Bacteroidota bacterium]
MPKEKNYKWKLGLFAVTALVVAVAAIYYVGKQKNLFGSVFHLNAVFHSVSGLKVGSNVRFGGIDVGTVDDIHLTTDTTVAVEMVIQHEVQRFIKQDALASIGSEGLMGDKVIVISPGDSGRVAVRDADILQTHAPIETDQIMASLKTSADNAAVITANLADIASRINHGQGALGKLLRDTTLSSNISATMKNLRKSTAGLDSNMEAAKHSFLLKGYFKKAAKQKEEEQKKKDQEEQKKKQGELDKKAAADKNKPSGKKN